MRNTILGSLLVVGALGGVAQAERKELLAASADAAQAAAAQAAAVLGPARTPRTAARFTGDVGLLGEASALREESAPRKAPYLTPDVVSPLIVPFAADIERCYLGAAGKPLRSNSLSLTLAIARDGSLLSLQAAAPGASTRALRKISGCARAALEAVQFPERRNNTTVIVPYYFQKTSAPGAGPLQSCWNAKGC